MTHRYAPRICSVFREDVIGTKAAVLKAARKAIAEKKSIINLAKEHNIPYRILWHIRDGRAFNALRKTPVPEVAYAVYTKHFVEPTENVEIVY